MALEPTVQRLDPPTPLRLSEDVPAQPAAEDARGRIALTVLAVIAVVFALHWARHFVIPLLLGILGAYTLNPIVAALERLRVPRVIGATCVMVGVVAMLAVGGYSVSGEAERIVETLPGAAAKVTSALARLRVHQGSIVQTMQSAANRLEEATQGTTGEGSPPMAPRPPPAQVVVAQPASSWWSYLWAGSAGAAAFIGQAAMVAFLTYFLLIGGDRFKRKLVKITGPSLTQKKITVQILDEIDDSIQKYMLMLVATNVLVALLSWAAFRALGLADAGAWAVAAGLLHIVPYLGPLATAVGVGVAAFTQFDTLPTAALAAGASLGIATLVGTFITTWMTGRIASMNSAAIFVSLLFWGWLWGLWGMLLAIPIVVIAKVVAQRIPPLGAVAELLGE